MSKLRNFVFTLNNPNESGSAFQTRLLEALPIRYLAFQLEQVTTPHFQGYCELSSQRTFASITRHMAGAHLEPRKGTAEQASTYATKLESRVDGPWVHGELTSQGRRTDLATAVTALREGGLAQLIEQHPIEYVRYHRGLERLHFHLLATQSRPVPVVTLLFGPPGCGKTRLYADKYPIPSVGAKVNLAEGWFDGYTGQSKLLMDDFDGNKSGIRLCSILQCLDRYPFLAPVKGAHVPLVADEIYVSTNYHPKQWYDWTERGPQYHALFRRFTRIIFWPRVQSLPLVITPGSVDNWNRFMDGPYSTGPVDLNKDDIYWFFTEDIKTDLFIN